MADKIIMPQGGQDLKYGTIVRWLKKENDAVVKGEVVCEVETEKAVFEVTAPSDGHLIKIIKMDGEEAEILTPIGYIGKLGEQILEEEKKNEKSSESNTKNIAAQVVQQFSDREKIVISPKARKLAADHGIDIADLVSSRPDGKIKSEDVQQVIDGSRPLSGQALPVGESNGERVKISKIQKITAQRLQSSWQQAPHIFVTVSVDMTDASAFRKQLNQKNPDLKLSFNDLIVKAVAKALMEFSGVNASYVDDETIFLWKNIHVGIAVAVERGLLVPVVENAETLTLKEISARTKELADAARDGKQISTQPSTFTISNLGMYDVDQFTAVINPPESAILAVASIKKMPQVDKSGKVVVKEIMQMTLSMDHRIGDGVLAAQFLNRIKQYLQDPSGLE